MDWFRKRCAEARMKKFFGPPLPKGQKAREFAMAERRKKMKKNKVNNKELLQSVYGYWYGPAPTPTTAFKDGRAFAYHLCAKKGYKVLGMGHFSLVVGKDGSDKVIKIGHNPSDRWIEYCKWAAENGFAGNFAPTVYSYKYIKGTERDFAVSVVEKLKDTFYKGIDKEHDYFAYQSLVEYQVSYGNKMAGTLADLVYPGSSNFLTQFKEKFPKNTDMHGGNIMIRGDSSICFSDPVAGHNCTYKMRLKHKDFTDKAVSITPEVVEALPLTLQQMQCINLAHSLFS